MARRRAVLVLRAVASVAMLAVLVSRVRGSSLHLRSIVPHWTVQSALWLAGGVAVTAIAVVLATLRWHRVLLALDRPARVTRLLSHQLAGLFVSNFLISTIGGDVLRVARLSADTGEASVSFASVVLERLTGWVVLPFITLFALATHPTLLHLHGATRLALLLALGTLVLLVVVLAAAGSPRLGGRLAGRPDWRRFAGAIHLGVDRLRRRPSAAASVIVVGFAYQLAMVMAAWMAAHALGLRVGWAPILAFVPAVLIAQVLPISIGGLGVREGAFVLFLHPLGVSTPQAIALGLLVYGMTLVTSLLGAPAFAFGARPVRLAT